MKVLVFGAGGKTGRLVVEQALLKQHEVTVLVRDRKRFQQEGVRVLEGDATIPDDVLHAMEGQDAVVDTIGGTTPYKKTNLERVVAHNIIEAMHAEHVKRLVVISMMGIGGSRAQAPLWYKLGLMKTFLRGSTEDKIAMEQEVGQSGLDFVITRPPMLKDGPSAGAGRVLREGATGHQITRTDLAHFMVEQLRSDDHLGQAVTVVNS